MPSNLALARIGARKWIAVIMVVWGTVSVAMIFVVTPRGFYLLRFLLGAAEAGIFPRHDPLPEAMVSLSGAGAGRRLIHDGRTAGGRGRGSDLGRATRVKHGASWPGGSGYF